MYGSNQNDTATEHGNDLSPYGDTYWLCGVTPR